MTVLVDTNILLRLAQPTHPMHATSQAAVSALQARGETLRTVPQNLYEFWAAATRPVTSANGLGLTTPECQTEVARIKSFFPVLPDAPTLMAGWEALVVAHDCKGKAAHDARIVAAMRNHAVTHILTFNGADFVRYRGLTILDPAAVAGPPPSAAGPIP